MKVAFLTEMSFEGKIPATHPNMRTEFAWMHALNADHFHIRNYKKISDYDHVLYIFPKGDVNLNAFAAKKSDQRNPVSDLLSFDFVEDLKKRNRKVHFVQEGPHWLWNDYEIVDQINYYNMIASSDSIFCHNQSDTYYYLGMFPRKKVVVMPSLMIEDLVKNIVPFTQDKAIIGGNFARWYGGFESYMVAQQFNVPIYAQTSHAMRENEAMDGSLIHLPRMQWIDWMKELSTFKFAVHMMPTVAAGTFALNCAYFGIPCIGNSAVDTQKRCHTHLSCQVNDIEQARSLAKELEKYPSFYEMCSKDAKQNYKEHYSIEVWKKTVLNEEQ